MIPSDVLFYTGIFLMCYVSLCVSYDNDKHRCRILISWSLKNVSLTFSETGILRKGDETQPKLKIEIIKPGVINETVFDVRCCDGYFENDKNRCKKCPINTYGNNCTGVCKCVGYRKCDHVTGECIKCVTKPCEEAFDDGSDSTALSTPHVTVTTSFQNTATSAEILTTEHTTYKRAGMTQEANCKVGYGKAAGHGANLTVTTGIEHTVLIAAVISLGLSTIVLVVCIVTRERYHHQRSNIVHDYITVNKNNIPRLSGEHVYSERENGENGNIEMVGIAGSQTETEANFYSIIRDDDVAVINFAHSERNIIGEVEVNPTSATDYEDVLGFSNTSVGGMSISEGNIVD